jgi:hypothetical protein
LKCDGALSGESKEIGDFSPVSQARQERRDVRVEIFSGMPPTAGSAAPPR